jgi:hypothetical protein
MIEQQDTNDMAVFVSRSCNWDGASICAVFLESLTDANFHTLREQLEGHIKEYFAKEGC